MKLEMDAYDLVALEQNIIERLGTFTTWEKAIDYGERLIEAGEEDGWAWEGHDGISVSGPYKLLINPEFKQEKK
jgi:hypothetical protein